MGDFANFGDVSISTYVIVKGKLIDMVVRLQQQQANLASIQSSPQFLKISRPLP
jgi:hypothetical protein